jgi:hypothetical protein
MGLRCSWSIIKNEQQLLLAPYDAHPWFKQKNKRIVNYLKPMTVLNNLWIRRTTGLVQAKAPEP